MGIAVAAIATAASLAVMGLKAFGKTVEEEARKLALYSGEVAGARAETEIRELHATLRRAQRIGPDVARWESMRGQFAEKTMDVQTELLNVVLTLANDFEASARLGIDALEATATFLKTYETPISTVLQLMIAANAPLASIVNNVIKLVGFEEDKEKKDDAWQQFDQILTWGRAAPFRQPANPAQQAPRRPLGPNFGPNLP